MTLKIGKKIKELRTLCNLTQEELASRTELTKGYISQLENDLAEPSVSTLYDIISALGTNMSDFFLEEKQNQIVFTQEDYFIKERYCSRLCDEYFMCSRYWFFSIFSS